MIGKEREVRFTVLSCAVMWTAYLVVDEVVCVMTHRALSTRRSACLGLVKQVQRAFRRASKRRVVEAVQNRISACADSEVMTREALVEADLRNSLKESSTTVLRFLARRAA